MNVDQQTVAALAEWLTGDPGAVLTEPQRSLLRSAVVELGASQALVARQGMLLASFDADAASIETSVRAGLDSALARPRAPSPGDGFDLAAAREARVELARKLTQAASVRDIVSAALSFVARLAR